MKIVAFLQNPWSPYYVGGTWPRENWLPAFAASRSGKRVIRLFGNENIWWDNASPLVVADPKGISPPDLAHMRRVINEQMPDVIITFGMQAKEGMKALYNEVGETKTLHLPHPAYRMVTDELFRLAKDIVKNESFEVLELKQGKSVINRIAIPKYIF